MDHHRKIIPELMKRTRTSHKAKNNRNVGLVPENRRYPTRKINKAPVTRMMTTKIATLPYPPVYQQIKGEGEGSSSPSHNSDETNNQPPVRTNHQGIVPIDLSSQQGKFGWTLVGQEYLPFIQRGIQRFCAVRMIETNVLTKHFKFLHSDIYSCTCIRSYYLTNSEAGLLTSINKEHCEGRYGKEEFGLNDLVVKLEDVRQFCDFLRFCYEKLICPRPIMNSQCGFLHINGESVIAFAVKNGRRYVPLFYFEGVNDQLKTESEVLDGWEVAYLKFCCKIQGIKKEFLDNNICSVINLESLKTYFPPDTNFVDYWPLKHSGTYLTGYRYLN